MTALLGIMTKLPTPRRLVKQTIRGHAGVMMPNNRVALCGSLTIHDHADIIYNTATKRANVKNVLSCGSVWSCPVCSERIANQRRKELEQAIKQNEGRVFMVTFTMQHYKKHELSELLEVLTTATTKTRSGKSYTDFRRNFGIIGHITSLETTASFINGWHPHQHVAYFYKGKLTDSDYAHIQEYLSDRFIKNLKKQGHYGMDGVSVVLTADNQAIGNYVSKWGIVDEMTLSNVKRSAEGHYTLFELLKLSYEGDTEAGRMFVEGVTALTGRKQLRWSKGLKALLLIEEVTDDQILIDEDLDQDQEILIAQVDKPGWKIIHGNNLIGHLLQVVELEDREQLELFMDAIGLQLNDHGIWSVKTCRYLM